MARWQSHQNPGSFDLYASGYLHSCIFWPAAKSGSDTAPKVSQSNGSEDQTQNESMDPMNSQHDILEFIDDAGIRETVVEHEHVRDLSSLSLIETDLSVVSFLKRPTLYRSGTFSSTDSYGNLNGVAFTPWHVPSAMIASSTLHLEKLKGILGMRAKTIVTVVVNATRFTQGLYGLFYVPSGGAAIGYHDRIRSAYLARPVTRSQLPHVKIDLSCDTKVELEIPYVSSYNFLDLTNITSQPATLTGDMGSLVLAPWDTTTVLAPSSESAKFSIYFRFEDISLIGATLVPQMDISSMEAKSKNAGPIQVTAQKVSKAASMFTKVPLISDYASSVVWASNMIAGVASVFGWSRPTNHSHYIRNKRKPLGYLSNVDELDNSDSIGLFASPSVDVAPGFSGTDIDELNIKQFCSRYGYLSSFEWNTAQSSGSSLKTIFNSPEQYLTVANNLYYIPLSYMTTLFKMWRGSIKYRFTVVRTEFHSGRLEFRFQPTGYTTARTGGYTWGPYLYRHIVDIREHNSFELEIPYISNSTYLNIEMFTGLLEVYVVDPLVGPSSVSDKVTVIIEVCGGDDIEFSIPREIKYTPVYNVTPQMDCSIASSVIGNGSRPRDTIVPAKMAMGERILTLRSLLKKFTASKVVGNLGGGGNTMGVRPKLVEFTTASSNSSNTNMTADLYSLISCCFALTRGGVRFKYVTPLNKSYGRNQAANPGEFGTTERNSYLAVATLSETRDSFGLKFGALIDTATAYDDLTRRNAVYFNPVEEHAVEIELPAYNPNTAVPVQELTVGADLAWPLALSGYLINYQPTVYIKDPTLPTDVRLSSDTQRVFVVRAGSDDFNLGVFVAIPPMRQFESIAP